MHHFITKFLTGALLILAVAALTVFNGLLLWVASGPRSINMVSPYIEAALAPPDHRYAVDIGETWLIWDGWKHPIDIRLRNVVLMNHNHERFLNFPEISLGLDMLALIQGELLPTSLTISHPVLSLYQNDDHSISLGFQPELPVAAAPTTDGTTQFPLGELLTPLFAPDTHGPLRGLRNVTVTEADISVSDMHRNILFKSGDAHMVFKKIPPWQQRQRQR